MSHGFQRHVQLFQRVQRAAVDPQEQRRGLALGARRQHEPRAQRRAVLGRRGHLGERAGHLGRGRRRLAAASAAGRRASASRRTGAGRRVDRRPQRVDVARRRARRTGRCRRRRRRSGARPSRRRRRRGTAASGRSRARRTMSARPSGVQRSSSGPAVPVGRELGDLAARERHQDEVDLRRAVRRRAEAADEGDRRAVGADPRAVVVEALGSSASIGALAGRDVDPHDDLARRAVAVGDDPRRDRRGRRPATARARPRTARRARRA